MNSKYKNTYVINMDKVLANVSKYVVVDNSTLPIIQRNGVETPKTEYISGCSVACIENMVNRFARLTKKFGKQTASTVTQYLDKSGTPIVTLYPTGEADILNNKWGNFDLDAQADLRRMQNEIIARNSR